MAKAQTPPDDVLKARQMDYYDRGIADPEFEINRPHGESRLYRYMMDFKFQRVIDLLGHGIEECTVLAICSGSGMDAEYLTAAGARVVALDFSIGCLQRARARSTRFGARYHLVQGDAERLPFSAGSFDYVFVHDGLHHLAVYEGALKEMARVARIGVLISEPSRAAITTIPTSLGFMSAVEEAGNAVNRANANSIAATLRAAGFSEIRSQRYFLKYGHPPARWWRFFDGSPMFALARVAYVRFAARLLAPLGNKLVLVAERAAVSS